MALDIYWLNHAENKLEDIYTYYSKKANKSVAQKLVNSIVNKTIGIGEQPEIGAIENKLAHRNQEFRYLVYKHY